MGIMDYINSQKKEVVEDKSTPTEEKLNEKLDDVIKKASMEAWGNPENDGTLREYTKGFYRLREDEFFKIARSLERWNAVFYKFWELGRPIFTRTIPTAAVAFDREGRCVNFIFNPDFWMALDPYTREFVICHEMLHVILNHGVRTRSGQGMSSGNRHAINATLDVVVNHSLTDRFDFVREKIDERFAKEGCWIDTVYERPKKIKKDKAFEYYFNQLPKKGGGGEGDPKDEDGEGKGEGEGQGEGGGGEGEGDDDMDHMENPYGRMVDDHGGLSEKEMEDIIDKLDENLTDEEKQGLKDLIEKHFEENDEDGQDGDKENTGKKAGKTALGRWHFMDVKNVKKKKKWETVIRKWVRTRLKIEHRDKEQWARTPRRNMLIGKDLLIPSEMEVEDKFQEKKKIEVWAFQDTSGSCSGFMDRFFTCMRTIPCGKYDPFKVRLFCFDTEVYPADIDEGKLRGGGGTCFAVIEEAIQQTIKQEGIKYPDSVWIVTDGYGTHVQPEKPERWHFFLSGSNDSCVPPESDRHLLSEFE